MLTDDETKQILEFAEWRSGAILGGTGYERPDGMVTSEKPNITDPTWLFDWVVPKLWICNLEMLEASFFVWKVGHPQYGDANGPAEEDAGEALCKAVLKMLKEDTQ